MDELDTAVVGEDDAPAAIDTAEIVRLLTETLLRPGGLQPQH